MVSPIGINGISSTSSIVRGFRGAASSDDRATEPPTSADRPAAADAATSETAAPEAARRSRLRTGQARLEQDATAAKSRVATAGRTGSEVADAARDAARAVRKEYWSANDEYVDDADNLYSARYDANKGDLRLERPVAAVGDMPAGTLVVVVHDDGSSDATETSGAADRADVGSRLTGDGGRDRADADTTDASTGPAVTRNGYQLPRPSSLRPDADAVAVIDAIVANGTVDDSDRHVATGEINALRNRATVVDVDGAPIEDALLGGPSTISNAERAIPAAQRRIRDLEQVVNVGEPEAVAALEQLAADLAASPDDEQLKAEFTRRLDAVSGQEALYDTLFQSHRVAKESNADRAGRLEGQLRQRFDEFNRDRPDDQRLPVDSYLRLDEQRLAASAATAPLSDDQRAFIGEIQPLHAGYRDARDATVDHERQEAAALATRDSIRQTLVERNELRGKLGDILGGQRDSVRASLEASRADRIATLEADGARAAFAGETRDPELVVSTDSADAAPAATVTAHRDAEGRLRSTRITDVSNVDGARVVNNTSLDFNDDGRVIRSTSEVTTTTSEVEPSGTTTDVAITVTTVLDNGGAPVFETSADGADDLTRPVVTDDSADLDVVITTIDPNHGEGPEHSGEWVKRYSGTLAADAQGNAVRTWDAEATFQYMQHETGRTEPVREDVRTVTVMGEDASGMPIVIDGSLNDGSRALAAVSPELRHVIDINGDSIALTNDPALTSQYREARAQYDAAFGDIRTDVTAARDTLKGQGHEFADVYSGNPDLPFLFRGVALPAPDGSELMGMTPLPDEDLAAYQRWYQFDAAVREQMGEDRADVHVSRDDRNWLDKGWELVEGGGRLAFGVGIAVAAVSGVGTPWVVAGALGLAGIEGIGVATNRRGADALNIGLALTSALPAGAISRIGSLGRYGASAMGRAGASTLQRGWSAVSRSRLPMDDLAALGSRGVPATASEAAGIAARTNLSGVLTSMRAAGGQLIDDARVALDEVAPRIAGRLTTTGDDLTAALHTISDDATEGAATLVSLGRRAADAGHNLASRTVEAVTRGLDDARTGVNNIIGSFRQRAAAATSAGANGAVRESVSELVDDVSRITRSAWEEAGTQASRAAAAATTAIRATTAGALQVRVATAAALASARPAATQLVDDAVRGVQELGTVFHKAGGALLAPVVFGARALGDIVESAAQGGPVVLDIADAADVSAADPITGSGSGSGSADTTNPVVGSGSGAAPATGPNRELWNAKRVDIKRKADYMVNAWDRDGNGTISVTDETTRTRRWTQDGQKMRVRASMATLLAQADRLGNGDGEVTRRELRRALRSYDTGNVYTDSGRAKKRTVRDGALVGSELREFRHEIGPRRVSDVQVKRNGTWVDVPAQGE